MRFRPSFILVTIGLAMSLAFPQAPSSPPAAERYQANKSGGILGGVVNGAVGAVTGKPVPTFNAPFQHTPTWTPDPNATKYVQPDGSFINVDVNNPIAMGSLPPAMQAAVTAQASQQAQSQQQFEALKNYYAAQLSAQAGALGANAQDLRLQADQAAWKRDRALGDLQTNYNVNSQQLAEDRWRNVDVEQTRNNNARMFTGREFQNLMDALKGRRGIADRTLNSAITYFNQSRQLAGKNLDLGNQRATFQRDTANDQARWQAGGSGAVLSGAVSNPYASNNQAMLLAKQGVWNDYTGQINGLDRSTRDARIGYDSTINDINATQRSGQLARDRATEQQNRQDEILGSLGRSYGLRADELRNALEQAARNLKVDATDLITRLTTAADSNDAQAAAMANALIQQAANVAGSSGYAPQTTASSSPTGIGDIGYMKN